MKLILDTIKKENIVLPDIAIETGTYKGNSTKTLAENFKQVFTIELGANLIEEAKKNCINFKNICFLNGDSSEVLKNLLPKISEKYLIFLDAHFSGGDTLKNPSKSIELLDELDSIKNYSSIKNNIIIIDDFNDYMAHKDLIESKIKDINPGYCFKLLPIHRTEGLAWIP